MSFVFDLESLGMRGIVCWFAIVVSHFEFLNFGDSIVIRFLSCWSG